MKKVKKTVLIAVCIIAYLMIIPTVVFCADMSASARFSSTYYGVLAPMYEKLASSDKKVVVIGNSAVAFGVNSALLQSELEASGLDFTVCNFGLYGAIGTKAMLDLAIGEISDGDIIIFTPEINPQSLSLYFSGSEFLRAADSKRSMLFKTAKENRGAIVGNYVSFVAEKLKLDDTGDKGGVYSASSFDENCDMTRAERKSNIMPNGYDSNNPIEVENAFGDEKFVEYVNEWSEKVNKKGATVYYSFAPMNELSVDCGSLDSLYEDAAEKFEFRVISDPKTCAYECEWFYDSNVHLNASGMTMNTLRLSNEIKNELGITSANITPVPEKPPLKMPDEPIEGDNSQADAFVFEENASGVKIVGLTQKGKEAQSLVLPSSYNGQRVTSLEKDVFSGNIRVREITVQENIAVLSDGSFAGCTSLERLVLRHADPEDIRVGYRLLDGAENVKIYVPEASLMAYSTDYYWGGTMSRILKHIKIFVAVFIMLAGVFICACSSPSLGVDGRISVTVEDSPYYTAENSSFRVESGESVSIALTFEDDCAFGGCSYDGYDLRQEGESTVLTLRNVIRPTRVKIEVLFSAATICYDGNGALFENEKSALLVGYDLSRHLRANTETIILLRDGYLHVGWNTKPDGSGEHIGLGSRITVTSGTAVTLYASWKKQNDASDFIYRVSSDTAVLEKYTGSAEADEIVIPREIDGLKVTGIAKGFAQRLKAKVLALPDTIVEVENGAFRDCDIEEIIFWDGVERISDSAFLGGKFKTWRLNAKLKPRYLASSEHVQFAENIDKLILLEDKRKLVFFGGCSMSYGLSSELIDEQFGSRFTVLNLGVIGGVDAGFQFDCISNYLSDGDILVHAPEVGSVFQFMGVRSADPRIFMMAEGNFDLLALADMSCLPNAFATLAEFNAGRRNLPAGEYSDCTEVYNIYGDIIKPRPFTGEKYGDGSDSYGYSPECADSLGNLCDEYDAMREKGVEVYFSYSPVNLDGISERKRQELVWMDFEQKCDKALSERGYTVISSARDYLYSGEYFYDRDYHLNDKGAIIRTNQLIDDLKKVIAT